MQGKFKKISICALFFVLIGCSKVWAYTGNGTSSNPYVVTAESGLREILTELPKKTSWVYIAVNGNVTINKNITVSGGKYRIYAKGANRIIKRSSEMSSNINNQSDPQYCVRLTNGAEMVFGYNVTNYTLRLGGNKSYFTGKISSGWFNVSAGCKLTVGENALLTNAINNENEDAGSIILNSGTLTINGEISECQSSNGGAVSVNGGSVQINGTAKIHDCNSITEGGALFVNNGATLVMNGGKIYNNESLEEGGGIFIGVGSTGKIVAGEIYKNKSNKTGGGIFSGNGAILYVGEENKEGPYIYQNLATSSGGGIRCNGGLSNNAGGTTYFYSGVIEKNTSYNVGGGIACGAPGSNGVSKLIIKNLQVSENTSSGAGGGIWLPNEAKGISSDDIKIENCYITDNLSKTQGGGLTLHCKATLSNMQINYNEAEGNGGGIYIGENAIVCYKGEKIIENVSGGYGDGVYVKGQFKITNKGSVSGTNEVYLAVGTYIEVIGKVSGDTYLNAVIRSAVTSNGTKIVKVNYSGADSETELYNSGSAKTEYEDENVQKRYRCNNVGSTQLLRAGKYIEGVGSEWIVISQEYKITYNKNIEKTVENMPEIQKKYWNEVITISNNVVKLNGYKINEEIHWNYLSNGKGTAFKPGSRYNENGNKTLYAQWIQIKVQELFINTTDRYYVVGQDIVLTPKEILKKVTVEDDLKTGNEYKVSVVNILDSRGNTIVSNSNIETEKYMNTSEEQHYVLKVRATDDSGGVTDEDTINVYIMANEFNDNRVRFISADFIYTLNNKSKWNNSLKGKLLQSLNNISNESNKKIYLNQEQIKSVKQKIKDNNYIITNSMNKTLAGSW